MSKIKNDGLDQCGTGPFEQQQFGRAGVEGVKHTYVLIINRGSHYRVQFVAVVVVVVVLKRIVLR